jgi:hypothetical protein
MLFALNNLAHKMEWERRKRKITPDQSSPEYWHYSYARPDDVALVRLTRKYANSIDGVNLEAAKVGDRLELSRRDASVLIAEGWAERQDDQRRARILPGRALAADSSHRPRRKPAKGS